MTPAVLAAPTCGRPIPPNLLSCADEFWRRVDRGDPVACWTWTGPTNANGYGIFYLRTKGGDRVRAHRFAYSASRGAIPKGAVICHTCDNPPCCNPDHLFLGTHTDNAHDKVRKGRQLRGRTVVVPNARRRHTAAEAREVLRRHRNGQSPGQIARETGVTYNFARDVARGRSWAWVSLEQEPADRPLVARPRDLGRLVRECSSRARRAGRTS